MNIFDILIQNNFNIKSVLDIGAHAGAFTFECKKYFPNAYYYMIEGNPISEQYIKNSNIDYTIAYLSNQQKATKLYKTKHNLFNTGDSLYKENTDYYNDNNLIIENIQTITLNDLFDEKQKFDLIKIDTQGSEIDIINGGLELCKKSDVMQLEASVYNYNLNAPMLNDTIKFMENIGFSYFKIISDIHHPNNHELLIQHDVLFSKRELK